MVLYPGYQTLPKKKFSFLGESGTQGNGFGLLPEISVSVATWGCALQGMTQALHSTCTPHSLHNIIFTVMCTPRNFCTPALEIFLSNDIRR